jgi:hypothetical protein
LLRNSERAEISGDKAAYFLARGNVCFGGKLSIFCAFTPIWLNFLHEFWSFGSSNGRRDVVWLADFLNRADDRNGIRLESAGQVRHMSGVT